MNSKEVAAATQIYQDFMPSSKMVQEEDIDILHLNLPGFKKEQLRVQLSSTGILKISGQRLIGQNKWQRFLKEVPVSANCDRSNITAKFENGILYVKQPKLITSAANVKENAPVKRQKTTLRDEFSKRDDAEKASDKKVPEKQEPTNDSPKSSARKEAKSLSEILPAEKTSTSSIAEDGNDSPKSSARKEAKSLSEKPPAEKTSTSSVAEDGKGSSSSSESEYEYESTEEETDDDDIIGYASSLAANLKMIRKVMKMILVALLVLGIEFYFASKLKPINDDSSSYDYEHNN